MYNSARMIGVTIGIIVGLIIAIFIIRYVNRNKKLTTEYDEMQKQIRGEGYKYAFYSVMILEAVLCVLTLGVVLPAEPYVVHFFAIFVGITVQACYCIWKGAYIGQNTNLQRYIILMAVVSVLNFSSAFMAWRAGELFADGKFQAPAVNLLCGLMFAVIGIVGLVKKVTLPKRSESPGRRSARSRRAITTRRSICALRSARFWERLWTSFSGQKSEANAVKTD